ncbi:hypothetical protein BKA82DRAFT_4084577 [Pisolithus tinctorius]|nr:hypothetical protein BKA82DRAFT_4084577 [Pisolithus tinctorius]
MGWVSSLFALIYSASPRRSFVFSPFYTSLALTSLIASLVSFAIPVPPVIRSPSCTLATALQSRLRQSKEGPRKEGRSLLDGLAVDPERRTKART